MPDAGCLNAYTSYESDDGSEGSCNCADGEDNDADGWFDLKTLTVTVRVRC